MADRTCSVADCVRPHYGRGFCSMHYKRWGHHGNPLVRWPKTPAEQRFWPKVEKSDDGCWLWLGSKVNNGYGTFLGDNGMGLAHRWSYEHLVGPIPTGMQLDHLCRVRHCVNPAHLEPVTQRENILRGSGFSAVNARKTHCPQGHEYTPGNLLKGAGRSCRICKRIRDREYRLQRKAAGFVPPPCSVDGCEKPTMARGWCSMHYARNLPRKRTAHPCSVPDCEKVVTHGGRLCSTHQSRLRKTGTTDPGRAPGRPRKAVA